jgi:hypothetical protein
MADKIFNRNKVDKVEEKPMIQFIKPVDALIKEKLHNLGNKGYSSINPTIITIEELKAAINEYKIENQIYTDIGLNNCLELSLSFKKILQIANLENLVRLEKLKLDNNMIMKIENLDSLINIKWLDLSFNQITKIEGLNCLVNLTDLSLFNNQICEVEGLDYCRKLNILSIGRNLIKNPKPMVEYLRKFAHLQALTVNDNPFCKEDSNIQTSLDQPKNFHYPNSYDVILATLERLKYLDYRPIDEENRIMVTNHYRNQNQKDRSEFQYKLDEEKEKAIMKEHADLRHANAEAVIDFYKQIEKKIKDDTSSTDGWEKMRNIPGLEDKLRLLEKLIEETLTSFKNDIIILQIEKDKIIKQRTKEIEAGQEKFVEQSKGLISDFKRIFKKFIVNIPASISGDEIENEIGLKALKDKLYEIEIYVKQKMAEMLKEFEGAVKGHNTIMVERTQKLKDELDLYKKTLKDNLTTLINDLSKKIEERNNKEGEGEEKIEHVNKLENNQQDEELDKLEELFEDPDLLSDVDKITEIYEEKIGLLKDILDSTRNNATIKYFENLNEKEYYRNRKRIEDINEIYEIYKKKLEDASKFFYLNYYS